MKSCQVERDNLPFVSVIVPVYNGEKVIGECIESLLNQTYPKDKYEIIVVDNNSTDRTAEIISKYPVKYVKEDKIQSPYAARNKGASIAKGDIFAFIDSDETVGKNWLINLLMGYEDKSIGAFLGKIVAVSATDSMIGRYWKNDETTKDCSVDKKPFLSTGNCAIKAVAFRKLNGFDPSLFSCGDLEMEIRLKQYLGLSIRYNPKAIIFHKEKSGWTSLLKREYRSGFGSYIIGCRYPIYQKKLLHFFIADSIRTILGVGAIIKGLVKPANELSRQEHLFRIVIDIATRWANFLGRCQAFITNGKRIFPANW